MIIYHVNWSTAVKYVIGSEMSVCDCLVSDCASCWVFLLPISLVIHRAQEGVNLESLEECRSF